MNFKAGRTAEYAATWKHFLKQWLHGYFGLKILKPVSFLFSFISDYGNESQHNLVSLLFRSQIVTLSIIHLTILCGNCIRFFTFKVNEQVAWNCGSGVRNCPVCM